MVELFWASNQIKTSLEQSENLQGSQRLEKLSEIEFLAADGAAILPVWLVKPRAWAQPNFSRPKFDGNGRLLLDRLQKAINE